MKKLLLLSVLLIISLTYSYTTKVTDYATIQKAINALPSAGGTVYFPCTTYIIYSSLKFNKDNVELVGDLGTRIIANNCDGMVFGDSADATRRNNILIRNLNFDLSKSPNGTGIVSHSSDEVKIDNVTINCGKVGIDLHGSYNVNLSNVCCTYQSQVGLIIGESSDKTVVTRGQFGNCRDVGISIRGGKGISIIGASIERNAGVGIEIKSAHSRGPEYSEDINIIGCYLERNCQTRGNAFVVIGTSDSDSLLRGCYTEGINLIGNYFNWDVSNPRGYPQPSNIVFIKLDKCEHVNIQGNTYRNGGHYCATTTNTHTPSLYAINDNAITDLSHASAFLRTERDMVLVPFSVTVVTGADGGGYYQYDLTQYGFSTSYASGNINTNTTDNSRLVFTWTNKNTLRIAVVRGPIRGSVAATGFIVGVR